MRKDILRDDNPVLRLSYFFALLYWLNCESGSVPAVIAKVSSTALLALHAHRKVSQQPNQTVTSLALHCVGDLLIELPGNSILYAIPAFFLGHAFYISALKKNCIHLQDMNMPQALVTAAFTIYGTAFTNFLMTKTSDVIQCAIPLYSLALTAMFILACLQKKNTLHTFSSAFLYVASDNIIALNMFVKKTPYASYLSWPSYYCAVKMMADGLQKETKNIPAPAY